ncbi:MAG: DnaJ domain-containing protein [Longimicrobiales bacterium]|nr:DnaJ domain-containing protein [Longimicrobiales bacterium]
MTRAEALTLLGLTPGCSDEDVRAAYRWMVQASHPDRLPPSSDRRAAATARTRSIIEAFEVLQEKSTSQDVKPEDPIPTRGPRDSNRTPLQFSEPSPEKVVLEPVEEVSRPRAQYGLLLIAFVLLGGVTSSLVLARSADPVQETAVGLELREVRPSVPAPELIRSVAVSTVVEVESVPLVRYSVLIGAFRDQVRAMALVRQLERNASRVWTTIVPVDIDGIVFHRVLVGLEEDLGALDSVISRVSLALEEDPVSWIIRDAAFTLCVSETPSVVYAERVMDRVAAHDIVPFALQSTDDSVRVCAGAFSGEQEADYLRSTLVAAGFTPEFIRPVGEPILQP